MTLEGIRSSRVRLHWLFVLIVLVAVMPVFALYFHRLQSNRERAMAEARAYAVNLAARAADVHADIGDKAKHVLEMVASSPALRGSNADCDNFLTWVQHLVIGQGTTPWMTGLFVTDPAGKFRCGTYRNAQSVSIGDRKYFQLTLANKVFTISDILIGRLSHRLIVAASLPIYGADGKPEMVLSLGADLQRLNAIAEEAHRKFGGSLLVLNQNDVAAVLPQPEKGEISSAYDDPEAINTLLASSMPSQEIVDRNGRHRLFGMKTIPGHQRIAVGLDLDAVLAPIEHTFRSDLLFLFLVAAASIAASLIVAEFGVLRGVRLLKSAALRLKAGKMGVRVKLPRMVAAELDDLAATYNAMTAEFERLAYLDRLTGLPNRRYLERQLLDSKIPEKNQFQAVLAIDLDGFKPVNDTYGHAVGDRVLAAVARRIATVVDERGLLARVGGDEFVAIIPLPKADYRIFARRMAEEIRAATDAPLDVDGSPFSVGCSIGIAMVPEDASSLAGALVVADAALYEAKRAGRNRVIDNAPGLVSEPFGDLDEDKQPHWTMIKYIDPVQR